MGFLQAMKGANNAWGTIICSEGVGTIGPENFIKNTEHKLMITIGTKTIVFSKFDVEYIKIIVSTSEWIKYLIELKNGKKYIAIFMALTASSNAGKSLSASSTGKKINIAIQNFEWWMFDLIYSNQNIVNTGNALYSSNPVYQNNSSTINSCDSATKQTVTIVNEPDVKVGTNSQCFSKPIVKKPEYWICKKCGIKNSTLKIYCGNCGEYK